jgi:phosphoribosylanthranilate isomerase
MNVKVCGITNLRDARACLEAGADAIGFIFAESPRRVSVKQVRNVVDALPCYMMRVGVFVDETASRILRIVKACDLSAVQLHGHESAALARKIRKVVPVIKVFHFSPKLKASELRHYPADAIMLETSSNQRGGSGKTWKWSEAKKLNIGKPIIVTGGLNPANVKEAVRILNPYAVDVSSGVEVKPGKKSRAMIQRFIKNAKS